MPLKCYPPRENRSKNCRIRGTYLGVRVDRSAKTPRRAIAQKKLGEIEEQIERGAFASGPTFVSAVTTYLNQGGERRFLKPLVHYFGKMGLNEINQGVVDEAAKVLYPPGVIVGRDPHNATINRQLYTPMSAIMATVGMRLHLRRPKQPTGRIRWLTPEAARTFIRACSPKLRPLAIFLLYTGCRISEATNLLWTDIEIEQGHCFVRTTKNGDPRGVHLPPRLLVTLANMPEKTGKVFGYPHRSHVYPDWHDACRLAGIEDFRPHDCCHTWATWMRRYGGRDLTGLAGTGRWKDARSASRYTHVVVGEDSLAADLLPDVTAKG